MELKGSVFKKFDKNNLFQVSCSDVRERFHLFVLLFIVVLQTMKEYSWKEGRSNIVRKLFENDSIIRLFTFRAIVDFTTGLRNCPGLGGVCRLDKTCLHKQVQ